MTLAKYSIATALWALFYLVIAFAVAIGFGAGWRLINSSPSFARLRRKESNGNGTGNGNKAAQPANAGT